ncbi:MAG: sporulation protein YqfD [Clostridia bacterium]|nr:sporulation protein YqfD [Clostridia bacterium]
MIRKLWNYLAGYVELRVRSAWPERLLNLAARGGAAVWDVRREDAETLRLSMRMNQWERLAPRLADAGLAAEVLRRRGFPVLRSRLEARPVLLFGLPVGLACLCVASLFIWDVRPEIPGEGNAELAAALRQVGIHAGAYAKGIDVQQAQNELLLLLPEYKWIAANIRGSRAVISLRRADPGAPPEAEAADLVAERDGLITGFAALAGTPAVKPGDTVRAGDILVWGYEENAAGERRPVQAAAWCKARSWATLRASTDLQVREMGGGEVLCRKIRLFFGKNAQKIWPWSRIPAGKYDTIINKTEISLSLACVTETCLARNTRERRLSSEEAEALLRTALQRRIGREYGEVLAERFAYSEEGDAAVLSCTFEAEGDLGVPAPDYIKYYASKDG